jgi:glycosyltransferase involved in cell wall biosynthesis
MSEVGVMHLLDTLALGGAERAAVNLVNELPRDKYRPYLCTTRSEGPLREAVARGVARTALERKSRFDHRAIRRLVEFIRKQKIEILHAHGSALFVAASAAWFPPHPIVIWHAHYGRVALENRRAWAHRIALRRARGVITVNQQLAEWCGRRLCFPLEKIWCIPNMVRTPDTRLGIAGLPGVPGSRIICVANLRAEKDHLNLVRAMALVVRKHEAAHLLLVGAHSDPAYSAHPSCFEAVKREVTKHSLDRNVTFLGQRQDISSLLHGCDIGVLSSKSEGLPVSLLEYGMAGLPVVSTQVGECEQVLDRGRAGVLVPSQAPAELAEALLSLLQSAERRALLGDRFLQRVKGLYSATPIMKQICRVYEVLLSTVR